MTLFPRCPDGHRWYACAHKELARPILGQIIMAVGAFQVAVGIILIMR